MNRLEKIEKYGTITLVDQVADQMRRERCLCLSCDKLKPNQPDNCPMAQSFFNECQAHGIALSVTRCADYAGPRFPL